MCNQERFDILTKFIEMYGDKPKDNNIININDDLDVMVNKFNLWYSDVIYFGTHGHQMDIAGFQNILKKFDTTFYPTFIKDKEIEYDNFIQNMLYVVTSGKKGFKYIFPTLIINILNAEYYCDIPDIFAGVLKFTIGTIGYNILYDLEIKINLKTTNLYRLVYDKLKNECNLYELDQLILLYNNNLILKDKNLTDEFLREIKQDML
jgi:hypothetical protein